MLKTRLIQIEITHIRSLKRRQTNLVCMYSVAKEMIKNDGNSVDLKYLWMAIMVT